MTDHKQQFIKNVGSGWLAQGSTAVVGFLALPMNLHYLGKEVYGISVLALSAIAILDFLNLGMGPALLRFFSQAIAKNDKEELAIISSNSQLVLGSLGVLGAFFILIGTPFFLSFYEISPTHRHETIILLVCLAAVFFQKFHLLVFSNIVMASHRFDYINFINITVSWLRFGLLFLFYRIYAPSLMCLGLATLFANIFGYLLTILISHNEQGKDIFFRPKKVVLSRLPSLFSFGMMAMTQSVFFTMSIQVPVLIMGKILGKETTALFAPAILISECVTMMLSSVCSQLTPMAAHEMTKKDHNLARRIRVFGEIVACLGYGCILIITIFSKDIITLWLGKVFLEMNGVVIVLVIGYVLASIQWVIYFTALGTSTIAPFAYSSVVMFVLTFLGTLLGTMFWHWGLLEVALCISAVRVLRSALFITWIYSKIFNFSLVRYFFDVYCKPSFAAIVVFLLATTVQKVFGHSDPKFLTLMAEMFIFAVLYTALTWLMGLSDDTRRLVIKTNRETK